MLYTNTNVLLTATDKWDSFDKWREKKDVVELQTKNSHAVILYWSKTLIIKTELMKIAWLKIW